MEISGSFLLDPLTLKPPVSSEMAVGGKGKEEGEETRRASKESRLRKPRRFLGCSHHLASSSFL